MSPKSLLWSMVLFLLLFSGGTLVVSASSLDSNNPTVCQFQPAAANRAPTLESIFLVEPGGSNISWDNSYLGLHRWTTSQWPGVDYTVPTTVMFATGGVISWLGIDGAGGGYSVIVDGTGDCTGWRQFIGHLDYNPEDRFVVGQEIGPNEVIGQPGCSGFDSNCTINGGSIPPHNHTTIGYQANVFNFTDGTEVVMVRGYWWVHPARLETENPIITEAAALEFDPSLEYLSFAIPEVSAPLRVVANSQNRNLFLAGGVVLMGITISQFIVKKASRKVILDGLGVGLLVLTVIVGIRYLQNPSTTPPPREAFAIDIPTSPLSFTIPGDSSPGTEGCSLPASYPESILQWCALIDKAALEYDLDPRLIAAVMLQESGGDAEAYSHSGAVGLMQIMPRDGLAANFICSNGPCFESRPSMAELYDPEYNIEYGAGMLSGLIKKYGTVREALYRYGPMDIGYRYADIVLSIYEGRR